MNSVAPQAGSVDDELDAGCVQTFDDLKDELEKVEDDLARALNLNRRRTRRELLALDARNELVENELVARWHELYTVYLDWLRWEERNHPPPPPQIEERKEQRAAEAALAVFVVGYAGSQAVHGDPPEAAAVA